MTRFSPDPSRSQSELPETYGVHFAIYGGDLVISGHVPSYEAKCRIEASARTSGYRVQNCLKVTPGLENVSWPSPPA
jgi:hypothetical protein